MFAVTSMYVKHAENRVAISDDQQDHKMEDRIRVPRSCRVRDCSFKGAGAWIKIEKRRLAAIKRNVRF